jgi:hypothetical protein
MALQEINTKTGDWISPDGYPADYIRDIEQCLFYGHGKTGSLYQVAAIDMVAIFHNGG